MLLDLWEVRPCRAKSVRELEPVGLTRVSFYCCELCALLSSGVTSYPIKWVCLPCVYLALYPESHPSICRLHYHRGTGKTVWSHALMVLDTGWMCRGSFPEKLQVSEWQTQTIEQLGTRHQAVLVMFLVFRKLLHSYTEGMCHSFTRPQHPGTSLHVISITRPSPMLVLQVTNAGVTRPEYEATFYPLYHSFLKIYQAPPSRA